MNKKQLVKKLDLFADNEEIVVLLKDNEGKDYLTNIEKITVTFDSDKGKYEMVIVPFMEFAKD